MEHKIQKIGFVEKNSDVPLKSVQEKALKDYGCSEIHICEDKFEALEAALKDLREPEDMLVVYSIAVIGLHRWNKVKLAVTEVEAQGIFSVKTNTLYKFELEDAQNDYAACMEIENAFKARVAKMGENNSGKPKSRPWKHAKQICAYVDDNWDKDELAAKYGTSRSTINRIYNETSQDVRKAKS